MLKKSMFVFLLSLFANHASASIELDTSFGANQGVTRTTVNSSANSFNEATSVVRFSNGQIVVAGITAPGVEQFMVLSGYNSDGILETEFAESGLLVSEFETVDTFAIPLLIQNDEKIIVAVGNGNDEPALVRYTRQGRIDESFGIAGVSTLSGIGSFAEITQIIILQNGQIMVLGSYADNEEGTFLVRLSADGAVDTSFAENGISRELFNREFSYPTDIVEIETGELIVFADGRNSQSEQAAFLAKFSANGTLDISYGDAGVAKIISTFDDSSDIDAFKMIQTDDGKFLLAIYVETQDLIYGVIARVLQNGEIDNSFRNNGIFTTGQFSDYSISNIAEDDGSYIVFGNQISEEGLNFTAFRLSSTGELDREIGTNGLVSFPERVGNISAGRFVSQDSSYFFAGRIENDFNLIKIVTPQPPVLSFAQSAVVTNEGSEQVTVSVNREGNADSIVSVEYATVAGTASEPSDFIADTGVVTFNEGETAKTISISIVDDNAVESAETFLIRLSNPQGGTVGELSEIEITIQDNDTQTPSDPPEADNPSSSGGTFGWSLILLALLASIKRLRVFSSMH
jgi:uncharacterized delta-60 repeat protein